MKKSLTCLLIVCLIGAVAHAEEAVTGRWRTTATLEGGPYVFDLLVTGRSISGTVGQSTGPQPGPVKIFDGEVTGPTVVFKATSPDGDRTVTFKGQVSGNVLTLSRDVDVRLFGDKGGAGVFGAAGPPVVKMQRVVRGSN